MRPFGDTRFGLALPQVFADGDVDIEAVRTGAVLAESLGFDSVWTQSQLVGSSAVLEPLTTLAFAAAVTSRVRLGVAVIVVSEHFPVQLAKQIATLDHLSAGRLIVNLGLGAPGVTASIGGHDMSRPVRRLVESVELMQALWTEEPANYAGQLWQLDDVRMNPKPLQRPHPPLWLGGLHADALDRAVRRGSGWMGPGAVSPQTFAGYTRTIHEALERHGRDRSTFTVAKRLYAAVDDSYTSAHERAVRRFERYGAPPEPADAIAALGPPERIIDKVREVVQAGADVVLLNPLDDFVEQSRWLAEIVGLAQEK